MARIEYNPFPLPLIQYEECWDSPLLLDGFEYDWKEKATTSDRLYYHHTLSSIRQHTELKQKCAPKDSLDLVLSSVYDQSEDTFRDKFFVMTQPETVGLPTYRLLKNKRLLIMPKKRDMFSKKLTVIDGKLARLENYASSFDEIPYKSRFKITERIKTLDALMEEFNIIQLNKDEDPEDEDVREQFEARYYNLKELYLTLEQTYFSGETSRDHSSPVQKITQKKVKLPLLELPYFEGQYEQWLHFRDTFVSVIDKNASLDDIDKLHYLVSRLKGEALRLIDSLELSGANYKVAWELLRARFENKKLLVNRHIQALFDEPKIEKESVSALRSLFVSVNKHLRALQSLDQPTKNWDAILICLIASKFDPITKRAWESENKSAELPTFAQMTEFMETRCRILESCNAGSSNKPEKALRTLFETSGKQSTFVCPVCSQNHYIHQCPQFLSFSPRLRLEHIQRLKWCYNCLRSGHVTLQCKWTSSCQKCSQKHNTLLHLEQTTEDRQDSSAISTSLSNFNGASEVILATALVEVMDITGNYFTCRALLDSGSQSNLMTTSLARALGLKQSRTTRPISGVGERVVTIGKTTQATLRSRHNTFIMNLEFLILEKITGKLPTTGFAIEKWQIPKNIGLADEGFNVPRGIDLLIGAQTFFELLCVGQFRISSELPIFQKTILGWIVSGTIPQPTTDRLSRTVCHLNINKNLETIMEKFWIIETVNQNESARLTTEETNCEQHFNDNTYRTPLGRFVVSLPFRGDPSLCLTDSKQTAERRFKSLERRFAKDPNLKTQYISFLNEYLEEGHMEPVKQEAQEDCVSKFYLPHHPVLKQDSTTTKLRVVFDGSSSPTSGNSLNQVLMVGPTVQRDLFSIVISFRLHRYVLTADIKQMYRQILLNPEQRDLQRILWRDDPSEEFQTFRLTTVTYGLACSPFLAVRCLNELADLSQAQYPLASKVTKSDFYMDDLMTGSNSLEIAKKLQQELIDMLGSAGLHLRKWCSNTSELLNNLSNLDDDPHMVIKVNDGESITTLGLLWKPNEDYFKFKVKELDAAKSITKRTILSEIAQLFDPLGLVGPVIVKAKILMQEIWQTKLNWDESLPSHIHSFWKRFRSELLALDELQIPRLVIVNVKEFEIHGFCDASVSAYGACLYLRSVDDSNHFQCHLLCSKSRVAPIKQISLPRLELSGALLLVELYQKVIGSFNQYKITRTNFWTDSTVTLCWIRKESSFWKTFVANRVAKIQDVTSSSQWHHIRGKDNPADLISRGCFPKEILSKPAWFHGPSWLLNEDVSWTEEETGINDCQEERKHNSAVLIQTNNPWTLTAKFSDFSKLKRVTAFCLRFIHNLRSSSTARKFGRVTIKETEEGLSRIIKTVQKQYFHDEWIALSRNQQLNHSSNLFSLCPFLDEKQIIRVGGRLAHSKLKHKHPILLPYEDPLSLLIARELHIQSCHAGPQALLATMRLKYWPIKGKILCRRVVRDCVACFRVNPRSTEPQMGHLPSDRVRPPYRPFINSGVDFCGPINIKKTGIKRSSPIKTYICLFVCMATKAIHIELVSDLSTQAFLAAVKRFMARRGKCANIYCDNATNFVGANRELKELRQLFLTDHIQTKIISSLADENIEFHFIPPRAPHFGGLWEAGIKTVKKYLFRSVGAAIFTFEELNTLLVQIEACVNSRPITPISNDPSDLAPLTPSHFLIGDVLIASLEPDLITENLSRLDRWQLVQQQMQLFWKRWSVDYLTSLQQRAKWTRRPENIKVGTMVLIKEDFQPPLHWTVGRVVELHPGADSVCRVVSVKTNKGLFKRAVIKLCPLPIERD